MLILSRQLDHLYRLNMNSLKALEEEFRARLSMPTKGDTKDELIEEAIGHYTLKLNNTNNPLARSLFLCCLGDLIQEHGEGSRVNQISLSYYEAACRECRYYGMPHAAMARVLMESSNDTIGVLYHLAIAISLRVTGTSLNDLREAALSVLKRSAGRGELTTRYLCAFICEKWIVVREVCNNKELGMLQDKMAVIGALMVYYRLKTKGNLRQQDKDMLDRISVEDDVVRYVMGLISSNKVERDAPPTCLSFELDALPKHEALRQPRTVKPIAQQKMLY